MSRGRELSCIILIIYNYLVSFYFALYYYLCQRLEYVTGIHCFLNFQASLASRPGAVRIATPCKRRICIRIRSEDTFRIFNGSNEPSVVSKVIVYNSLRFFAFVINVCVHIYILYIHTFTYYIYIYYYIYDYYYAHSS